MNLNIAISKPLGALLVLLGILALGGLGIAMTMADLSAAVDERDAKVGFVTRSLATRARPDRSPDGVPEGDLAVAADSDTLAAARIDALVRSTVAEAGGTVLSSRSEAKHDEPNDGTDERIEVQAVIQGRIDALQASLFHLETRSPLILVDSIALQPVDAAEGSGNTQSTVVTATMTLSAYWARPKP